MGLFSSTKHEERAHNFATEFLRVSASTRAEMIVALHRDSNRLLLIPRARKISEELRNRKAPFQALYDFETGLARTVHPGRRWHPGAQYFYAGYFKDRAAPYRTALHNLSAAGQLNGAGLVPLLARMDHSDGRSFVLLFLEELVRPLNAGMAGALKSIETDHHRLKDALAAARDSEATPAAKTQRVIADFQKFRDELPDLANLYLLRAEADRVLEPYVAQLRRTLQTTNEDAAKTSVRNTASTTADAATVPGAVAPPAAGDATFDSPTTISDADSQEFATAVFDEAASEAAAAPGVAPVLPAAAAGSDHSSSDPPGDNTLEAAAADSLEAAGEDPFDASGDALFATPGEDTVEAAGADYAEVEADIAFAGEAQPHADAGVAGEYTTGTNAAAAGETTGKINPATDPGTGDDAALPAGDEGPDSEIAEVPIEQSPEFQEFLAARRAEMQDIERRLQLDLAECQREIEAVGRIAEPAERVDETSAALLGDDQYRHYRADLEAILADADQLFARIFALLSKLARRLTVAEMRRFVDHLIEQLSRDQAIREREPHLIPRLVNYRNSLKEDAPRLLNQIHARLAEIRREYKDDPAAALRMQLDYLQARLTDASFRGIWPTIFTIYQNLVAQQFDAQVFREIAEQLPLERQHRVLASLREGFREGGPARAAIDRRMRGAELAGIGERIQQENATGESEELPEILARLESNHHFDPVERVRQEIRDFDAGLPAPGETSSAPGETDAGATAGANSAPDASSGSFEAHQESGWTVERTRRLLGSEPARAIEFAGRALSAGEVDAREKELLAEFVEELGESDPGMARLYIFHRSVESAGGPREQLDMIRRFRDLLPAAVIRGREENLRRAVARAPVPGQLNGALKEKDRAARSKRLREIVRNPHLPGGVRHTLQAKRDTPADAAFATAFESICISPHTTRAKIQLLQTLGALARARGWLTEERRRKLEDRIRLYQRISRANQAMDARYAPERSFFLQNAAQLIQKLRAGRPPAEILQERDRQVYGVSIAKGTAAPGAIARTAPEPTAAQTHAGRRSATATTRRPPVASGAKYRPETSSASVSTVVPPNARGARPASSAVTPSANFPSVSESIVPDSSGTALDFDAPPPQKLDDDFMNTPIELEHEEPAEKRPRPAQAKPARSKKASDAKSHPSPASVGRPAGASAKAPQASKTAPGFFGKLLNRVTGAPEAGEAKAGGKQETISIARLTTRAEKLFLKGDRRDPRQLLDILHTPEDLLELLLGMPEMKKNPAAKRDKAAEAIKSAIAVTVIVPKKNRVLGMPGSLCFPRKDWNNELKRKNLVKTLNALAEGQLPGSEKYNYYKFLAEEVQFNYYQGKYKHGRI